MCCDHTPSYYDHTLSYYDHYIHAFIQAPEYNKGHIKHSINVPLGEQGGAIVGVEDGNFAMWVR